MSDSDEIFLGLRQAFFAAADTAREAEDHYYDVSRDWRVCCEAVDIARIEWAAAKTRLENYLDTGDMT